MRQRILIALGIAIVGSAPVFGTEYFVATNGDNLAAGTAGAPWRTLQHAANRVAPGDRVVVRPGNYVGFYLSRSGTSAAPIEFFAEPGALINQRNATTPDGINLERASHIIIDGFAVSGMPRAGVRSVGVPSDFAEFVTVRNVQASNNGTWGIFTGHVDDLLIESNRTWGSIDEHGIYVSNSGDRPVIRNNVIFDNHGSGIHMNGDESQGGDGIISDALVSGNVIYNNAKFDGTSLGGGSGINMDGVQNSRIENNLLYNNHASGISLYSIDAAEGASDNVVINNTVYQPNNGRWALNIRDGSTGNSALNNILLNQHSLRGAISIDADSLSGFTSDYNVVISRFTTDDGDSILDLQDWREATGNDQHSLVATAAELFVNPAADASGNYHLLATAGAINTGTNQFAPTDDLDGLLRPVGAQVDIGAYEWRPAALAGDYNGDGTVDAADYVVWRKTGGSQSSYDQWRTNFGHTGGSGSGATGFASAAVPEPTAIVTLVIASLVGRPRRRRAVRSIFNSATK
ncbi:MAG TPA: right-handed parallel beta-helix repeat-containing protein [Lacipirellulaceae bacterium]|nr:right-handed parallel beta-helix repeat-containing protein [Lacipirellulaceae bacterium]